MAISVPAFVLVTPQSAHAHGLGGIDASRTSSKITSIVPTTNDFSISIVENSENLIFERITDAEIIILGIDSEPYLLFNSEGVFENKLSPTRLINDQSTEEYSPEKVRREFAETSDDPNAEPIWEKISNSNSYRFHDHRAHYMGDVPKGVTDLGTNAIEVLVDSEPHTINFELYAGKVSNPWPVVLTWVALTITFFAILKFAKKNAQKIFNRKTLAGLSLIVITIQSAHIIGYIRFSYEGLLSNLGQSAYALGVVALFSATFYVSLHSKATTTEEFYSRHAPLLSISGITGLIAGSAIEFASLIEPFPASTLSSNTVRLMIFTTATISSLFLMIGVLNIKPSHISELNEEPLNSNP